MSSTYNPKRQTAPISTGDPMEIELVYNVRPCGTCNFFWPDNPNDQSYGPYPLFDFKENFPKEKKAIGTPEMYEWLQGKTVESGFPNGEVMDGCRKTPIMTIGINPNMTAFAPGTNGASWAYPRFTSDDETDGFAKYAYYYRYRNVYQERYEFDYVKQYLLTDSEITVTENVTVTQDQIKASKNGKIVSAERPGAGPTFDLGIKYDGEDEEITITLQRDKGLPRYVLLFDDREPNNVFKAGDAIAAKLNVPAGEDVNVYQKLQTYYEQFVPTLNSFSSFLKSKGFDGADLKIGEDVGQLDMVGCASPHWKPSFLGGTEESENLIISNCVSKNAWAMKQLVMTRPSVLFLVGESSFNMFRKFFGNLIYRNTPLPERPSDYAFTLFHDTIDSNDPTMFKFETEIDGTSYKIETRLIVTPHFSFSSNFVPQIRLYSAKREELQKTYPECFEFFKSDKRIKVSEPDKGYDSYSWTEEDNESILSIIQDKYADCWAKMSWDYYNPHAQMAEVLEDLYTDGKLSYDTTDKENGYLKRSDGGCKFCVNKHWTFPEGCPYDKNKEDKDVPASFISKVVEQITAKGKPQKETSDEKPV